MAVQGGIPVHHSFIFPYGCFVVGEVSQVLDFDASTKERPVAGRDKATGELVWSVPVVDADPNARAAAKSVTVKIVSPVEPVIPAAPAELAALGLPFVPVEFVDLTVTPWVNDKHRLSYSFKARGMRAAGTAAGRAAGGAGRSGPVKDG